MPDTATRPTSPGAASLSVFFPCFNEQDNIRRVYESAAKVLGHIGMDYEVILVDDGSTDQTPQIADAITQVGVHHYPRTRGRQTGAHPRGIFRAFRELFKFYQQING